MFSSILVPLDRSSTAEQAIPWAMSIARPGNARVHLVQVHVLYSLEQPLSPWERIRPELDARHLQNEQDYLDAVALMLRLSSTTPVNAKVLSGSTLLTRTVADRIITESEHSDLIVIASHGRAPAMRIAMGSVADELVRRSPVPVLVTKVSERPVDLLAEEPLDHILVPLDGSRNSEEALEPAMQLIRQMSARCTLMRAIPERGSSDDFTVARMYLDRHADVFARQHIEVETCLLVGRPAETIMHAAVTEGANLIALSTRGLGGIARMSLGSVADRLMRESPIPLLVCSSENRPANVENRSLIEQKA